MGRDRTTFEESELNLVPIMNLVTMLIPFLLLSAQFIEYSIIESTLPAISNDPAVPGNAPQEDTLTLMTIISDRGFTITGADAVLDPADTVVGPIIPCKGGKCTSPESWDYKALTQRLSRVKGRFPAHEDIVLVPAHWVPYEVIVLTMDATRDDKDSRDAQGRARKLFPNVVLAAGLE